LPRDWTKINKPDLPLNIIAAVQMTGGGRSTDTEVTTRGSYLSVDTKVSAKAPIQAYAFWPFTSAIPAYLGENNGEGSSALYLVNFPQGLNQAEFEVTATFDLTGVAAGGSAGASLAIRGSNEVTQKTWDNSKPGTKFTKKDTFFEDVKVAPNKKGQSYVLGIWLVPDITVTGCGNVAELDTTVHIKQVVLAKTGKVLPAPKILQTFESGTLNDAGEWYQQDLFP
jgi:hypothetical protein